MKLIFQKHNNSNASYLSSLILVDVGVDNENGTIEDKIDRCTELLKKKYPGAYRITLLGEVQGGVEVVAMEDLALPPAPRVMSHA